jgi:RNA 2',3'-cyclic 3'-phosphodiesterase
MVQERQIRSFIAIELPSELKAILGSFQDEMVSAGGSSVKWVSPDSIHITLKFLGNIFTEKVQSISSAIEQACAGVEPFILEMGELGGFPNLKQPRVLWVGLHGDIERVKSLQMSIDNNLAKLGFDKEKREFTPHITLARMRDKASSVDRKKFGERVTGGTFDFRYKINVESINLMRSQLLPSGAVYSCLAKLKLGDTNK